MLAYYYQFVYLGGPESFWLYASNKNSSQALSMQPYVRIMRLANDSRTFKTGLTWYNVLTELLRDESFVRLVTNPQRYL